MPRDKRDELLASYFEESIRHGRHTCDLYTLALPGKDPPHIYLHGATLNLTAWYEAAKLSGYRSLLMDLPGHGLSPDFNPKNPFTLKQIHDCVALNIYRNRGDRNTGAFLGKNERFVLVGHSLGGKIAQLYAANHPLGLEGLVLISTSYNFGKSFHRGSLRSSLLHARTLGLVASEVYQIFAHLWHSGRVLDFTNENIKKMREELLPLLTDGTHRTGTFAKMIMRHGGVLDWDISEQSKAIKTPTTIIHGDHDWLVPPQTAQELADLIIYGDKDAPRPDAPPVTVKMVSGEHCLTYKDPQLIANLMKQRTGKKNNGNGKGPENGWQVRRENRYEAPRNQI